MAFLEVPSTSSAPSIVANLVPEDEQIKEINDIFDAAMNTHKSKPVKPNRGFCVKLHRIDLEQKAFINICHTEEIPPPDDVSDEELTRILESEDPSSYRIPLSLGVPHEEQDKGGNPCMAYDIIINSSFYKKVNQSELFKTFVILLSIQGVEDKYSVQLSRDTFVVLQNKKYWGTMPEHYIQDRGTVKPAPLIDEIHSAVTASTKGKPPSVDVSTVHTDPRVRIHRVQKPGRTVEHLVAEIQLDNVQSADELSLHLATDRIHLQSETSAQTEVDLFLPVELDVNSARAQYDYRTKALRIDAPLLSQ